MQFCICMPFALPQEDSVKPVPKQGVRRDRFAWTWSRVGPAEFLAETALNCCQIAKPRFQTRLFWKRALACTHKLRITPDGVAAL
jgi:hypothetical protein